MILYEPALAKENHGSTWGSDPVSLRYPMVNTCLTLTLVLGSKLVGAHFGLLTERGAPTSEGEAKQILLRMAALAPPLEKAKPVLLIGNHGWWCQKANKAYMALVQYVQGLDDEFDPAEWDTENYGTVDIEVFQRGLITIRKTDGSEVVTRSFSDRGGISKKAKKLLGI